MWVGACFILFRQCPFKSTTSGKPIRCAYKISPVINSLMRQGWLEGTTNMWPAGLLLCSLTLHSINLPLFPTYMFKKEEGSLVKNALEELWKQPARERESYSCGCRFPEEQQLGSIWEGERVCVWERRRRESVWECVRTRGSKGRHARSQRERETCCHRKVSILTCSGLWKSQQPLTEVSRCSETMVFI